jgi:hypothetical protein
MSEYRETRSAVEFFRPDHPMMPITVRQRLEERRTKYLSDLEYAMDWNDFQKRIGVINGLGEAISVCVEAEDALRG